MPVREAPRQPLIMLCRALIFVPQFGAGLLERRSKSLIPFRRGDVRDGARASGRPVDRPVHPAGQTGKFWVGLYANPPMQFQNWASTGS
jgi:hypothetical protein